MEVKTTKFLNYFTFSLLIITQNDGNVSTTFLRYVAVGSDTDVKPGIGGAYPEIGNVTSKHNGALRYRICHLRAITIRSCNNSDVPGAITIQKRQWVHVAKLCRAGRGGARQD